MLHRGAVRDFSVDFCFSSATKSPAATSTDKSGTETLHAQLIKSQTLKRARNSATEPFSDF